MTTTLGTTDSATKTMKASTLTPGDKVKVDSDDLGSFTMTFTGRDTDSVGSTTLMFDAPSPVNGLILYPYAFDKGVDVGTYSHS